MPTFVEGDDCISAWAKGVLAIKDNHAPISPLITEISDPSHFEKRWLKDYCPRRIKSGLNSLHSVIEMVAPDELLDGTMDRAGKYNHAWRKFDRSRAQGLHLSNWRDTYFERLTRDEGGVNRLEVLIAKMNSWDGRRVAPFFAHTTYNTIDPVVAIGNPCLQYIQFLQRGGDRLDMLALYRNHDFLEKALGNFIGLGRLLAFTARETDQTAGSLVCISANAYLDQITRTAALARLALA